MQVAARDHGSKNRSGIVGYELRVVSYLFKLKRLKMRKFKVLLLVVALSVFIVSQYALSTEFWGSVKSNIYHYPHCEWAQKINPQNLIKFSSPKEAKSKGYRACKVCGPPED